jgi:hypothetical protein
MLGGLAGVSKLAGRIYLEVIKESRNLLSVVSLSFHSETRTAVDSEDGDDSDELDEFTELVDELSELDELTELVLSEDSLLEE